MAEDNSITKLFDGLLKDETERKIMRLIIEGKEPDEIIDSMISEKKRNKNDRV